MLYYTELISQVKQILHVSLLFLPLEGCDDP